GRGGDARRSAGVGPRAGLDADAGDAQRGSRCERVGWDRGARASACRLEQRRGGGMRIGLIGCGWIAETHLESLSTLAEEVACVCDPDPGRLAWATGATGAEGFGDWESLLERGRPDAVFVLTPPRLHREVTVAALGLGIPVYLEKPVARDLDEARAIVEAVARTGVVCAIGYQWRAIDWLAELRTLFAERTLGLLIARMVGSTAGRGWFT